MQWMKSKRDRGIVWARCDAAPQSSALALLRYHLGLAAHHLSGVGGEYGQCHVVPSKRGYDWMHGRWRKPMAFEGATHTGDACLFAIADDAPPMLALPDVLPLATAHC